MRAASWPDGKFFSQSLLFPALIPALDLLSSPLPLLGGEGRADTGQVRAHCKSQSDLLLGWLPSPFSTCNCPRVWKGPIKHFPEGLTEDTLFWWMLGLKKGISKHREIMAFVLMGLRDARGHQKGLFLCKSKTQKTRKWSQTSKRQEAGKSGSI